jgi:hypothetical protein
VSEKQNSILGPYILYNKENKRNCPQTYKLLYENKKGPNFAENWPVLWVKGKIGGMAKVRQVRVCCELPFSKFCNILTRMLFAFLLLAASATANVIGIDFGSEYLKVSIIKPGM